LEYRIRKALKDHDTTFPNQQGQPVQHPTARWVLHDFVGIHLLVSPGQWPQVLNLTEEHQHLLQLLGKPYMRFYSTFAVLQNVLNRDIPQRERTGCSPVLTRVSQAKFIRGFEKQMPSPY
jgi:hypothetical protein